MPRMYFEMTGIQYDQARKTSPIQKYKTVVPENSNEVRVQYVPVPYTINFELGILAKDQDTFVTAPQERIDDLASMPSPYLDGLFDELIKDCEYNLEGTIETTRGCPYSCTYCEIGTSYYQKIRTCSG